MNDKLIRQINGDIAQALSQRHPAFLSGRRSPRSLLKDPAWVEGLSALFPIQARLSCAQVLETCRPLLDRVCPGEPEGGWLDYCGQYIKNIMFPEGGFAPAQPEFGDGAILYLTVLQILLDQERSALPFDPMMDFHFLTEEEYVQCDHAREYRWLLKYWREEFVYELMRLGMEVSPYKTLSHIAGVHYIAMTAARGLEEAGE